MISLPSLLQRGARLNSNGVATEFMGRQRLWGSLLERVAKFAGGLHAYELGAGERVALLGLNSDNYFESTFGIPWAGYCVVPLNTRWALAENKYAIEDSGTRVLMFDDAFMNQAQQLKDQLPRLEHLIYMGSGETPSWAESYEQIIDSNSAIAPSTRNGNDMAGIFYTGGTTGFPKGVMQSHLAIWASALGAVPDFAITQTHSYLHAAPMFHMADFAGSMGTLLAGAKHVFVQSFDAGLVLKTIATQSITHTLLVPAMIKMVLNHPDASTTDLSSLEKIFYGASPMPAIVLAHAMKQWPHLNFVQAYGQTELAPIITTLSAGDHRKGGELLKSAGRATPVSDIRLLDGEGKDVPLGQQGEVVVRGPHAMLGYWNKPEETAKALKDGWVFTGDAGVFDAQGYLYIVDRVKDMVVTGGENVFTTEVENALISHDAVQDVAVIGIPHQEWGEAVHGIVILDPNYTANGLDGLVAELIQHCHKSIAGYKCPKSITFREQPLPLSGAGKVLKTELRKPFWEGMDKQVN
ncbi:MAG: acyl-CoA synthetase (AMP-forming)/AMP-acid ligase II [Oceanicoccus sp.]|jgi:acyl-CoA synthetase (AMP-forming)/AMP-acid ligase II